MVDARMTISEYSNRVLNVIKAKYGLRDKSEALDRLILLYGDDFVDPNEDFVKKVVSIAKRHKKLHPGRKMSLRELEDL
jgi:hypothetical protein